MNNEIEKELVTLQEKRIVILFAGAGGFYEKY